MPFTFQSLIETVRTMTLEEQSLGGLGIWHRFTTRKAGKIACPRRLNDMRPDSTGIGSALHKFVKAGKQGKIAFLCCKKTFASLLDGSSHLIWAHRDPGLKWNLRNAIEAIGRGQGVASRLAAEIKHLLYPRRHSSFATLTVDDPLYTDILGFKYVGSTFDCFNELHGWDADNLVVKAVLKRQLSL